MHSSQVEDSLAEDSPEVDFRVDSEGVSPLIRSRKAARCRVDFPAEAVLAADS